MEEDEADVAGAPDAEHKPGAQSWLMSQEFRSLGDSLMQRRERQESAFTRAARPWRACCSAPNGRFPPSR